MITDGVLSHRRIDTDWQGQQVGEQQSAEGEHEGQPETFSNHVRDRAVVFPGESEITLQDVADPIEILNVERAVETQPIAHLIEFLRGEHDAALRLLVGVGISEIAGWKLDENEGDDRHRNHQDDGG